MSNTHTIIPAADTWAVLCEKADDEIVRVWTRQVSAWSIDARGGRALVSCQDGTLKTAEQLATVGIDVGYVGTLNSAREYRDVADGLLQDARRELDHAVTSHMNAAHR